MWRVTKALGGLRDQLPRSRALPESHAPATGPTSRTAWQWNQRPHKTEVGRIDISMLSAAPVVVMMTGSPRQCGSLMISRSNSRPYVLLAPPRRGLAGIRSSNNT